MICVCPKKRNLHIPTITLQVRPPNPQFCNVDLYRSYHGFRAPRAPKGSVFQFSPKNAKKHQQINRTPPGPPLKPRDTIQGPSGAPPEAPGHPPRVPGTYFEHPLRALRTYSGLPSSPFGAKTESRNELWPETGPPPNAQKPTIKP